MTVINLSNGDTYHDRPRTVTNADVLIIGAGPAGASLACFLAYYGGLTQSLVGFSYQMC